MTRTQRTVTGEDLLRLMAAAWRQGVHAAWTADGQVLLGGPNTPAARAALDALRPYADLLAEMGLCALAESGIPPMASLEEARDYVVHAIACNATDRGQEFLETLVRAAVDAVGANRERGQ